MSSTKKGGRLISNRRALHDYSVLERFEAGIELRGTEVKSLRLGRGSLQGAYCQIEDSEAFLHGLTIPPYEFGNRFNHDSDRTKRLLLHRREIRHLAIQLDQKGSAVIPLAVYLKKGRVKLELGVCRGKRLVDKRETMKRRTADREAAREMRDHRR